MTERAHNDAEGISKSYVSRILRLALLALDIVEAILAGRTDRALMLEGWSGRCSTGEPTHPLTARDTQRI